MGLWSLRPRFESGRGYASGVRTRSRRATEDLVLRMFPHDATLTEWIRLARERLPWEGLPARVCWLGMGER
ncbi:MAG: hypothetical protein LC620_03735, partial [Halobacteriales archaeon]|nr:hypothetical protein [Halobacteriales archaeon]